MNDHPVILFDGVCNFCNGTINFIIKRDKKRVFRYAPLQSEAGQQLLRQHHLPTNGFDSFVLIDNGKAYKKTTAALHLYPKLGGIWKLVKALWILPPFIRDAGYNIIAANRYKWWGKKDTCMIPSPEVRSLFLS
jgi:predicted DCC family thiol-disulfide oxidoreductase YuxK